MGRTAANTLLPEHRLVAPAPPAPPSLQMVPAFVCLHFQGFMGGHWGGGQWGKVLSARGQLGGATCLPLCRGLCSRDECSGITELLEGDLKVHLVPTPCPELGSGEGLEVLPPL